jgi:hypothetical protein
MVGQRALCQGGTSSIQAYMNGNLGTTKTDVSHPFRVMFEHEVYSVRRGRVESRGLAIP